MVLMIIERKDNSDDKDINLELVMFACLISICCLYLVQTHQAFWPNTCLVSMCITGASGAANKQVQKFGVSYGKYRVEAGLVDLCWGLRILILL